MTECYVGVLLSEVFEGKSCHGGGSAEFEFEGWVVTEFEVVEIESTFFAAREDRDHTRSGGFGEEGEEVIDRTETSVIVESGEDLDSFRSF